MNELMQVENIPNASGFLACTITAQDTKSKLRLANALSNPEMLKNYDDKELKISDWVVSVGSRVSRETGETQACVNTTLIDVDGIAYFTQSNGVAREIRNLAMLFPDGPGATDEGYIVLKSVKKKMNNGNEIRTLVPIF